MKSAISKIYLTLLLAMANVIAFAQDSTTTITTKTDAITTTTEKTWYMEPWVWLVGAGVLVLLLIALLKGGGSNKVAQEKVTVTKTVERE